MALDDTAYQKRLYYARKELGLCVKCGMTLDARRSGRHVMCAECNERQRKNTEYRKAKQSEECRAVVERISIAVQKMIQPEELSIKIQEIPMRHRCWKCEWSTFCGDRFFCPIYGCCVRRGERMDAFDAM
jgi:hypothetical protein